MPDGFSLHQVAPRLARARDERIAELREEARLELKLATQRLQADRLLAHRELQALRSANTRNGKYVAYRYRKLEKAKKARAELG